MDTAEPKTATPIEGHRFCAEMQKEQDLLPLTETVVVSATQVPDVLWANAIVSVHRVWELRCFQDWNLL